jgi:chorismate--pyruvate lyase
VPAQLWDWLLDPDSLTRRLQRACGPRFHVRVLVQGWGSPLAGERRVLGMKRGGRALIREVRLMCGDTPWVFARTVIPVRTLKGRQRRMARLGTRPLGAALFADPGLRRGEVEIARLLPGDGVYEHAVPDSTEAVWGRRSVFTLRDKPLLVSEFFLPALLHGHGLE